MQQAKSHVISFYEAVIHSHARLTYNEVYAMVEQNDKRYSSNTKHVLPHLKELFAALSHIA